MRVVVTGCSRGIGLEFVRQLAARGDTVEAAARRPEQAQALEALAQQFGAHVRVHRCDVTDDASVQAFAAALGDVAVDLVVNNAGVKGKITAIDGFDDPQDVLRTFDVNALGPLRVSRALLPLVRKSPVRKLAHVTSGLGSLADNSSGGGYGYRMSKAALNMVSRSLAVDLRDEQIISVVLNPGWVQTDMGGAGAPTSVEDSVRGMLRVLDALTPTDSGGFFDFRGHTLPW